MIIDAHTHLFSPDVIAHRARYAERDPFFGQLYSGPVARMVGAKDLIAAMDAAGVDQAIVTGWCWQNHADCVAENSWTLEQIQKYPNRLIALAAIQPNAGADAVRELERCLDGGMVGLGELNADGQQFKLNDDNFRALARRAAELNATMLLHTNEPVGHNYPGKGTLPLADICDFAKAFPQLKLVLAHWGGGLPFYELMREVRKIAKNIYYDSAASPLLYSSKIFRTVIDIVGSEKVLFGSDFPLILYPKRQSEPAMMLFIEEMRALNLAPHEWANVMGENARRVYKR